MGSCTYRVARVYWPQTSGPSAAYLLSLAFNFGLLSPAPFDWPIDLACEPDNDYSLPSNLRFKLNIHRLCNNVDKFLDQQPLDHFEPSQSAKLHAWITLWEAQLDTFETHTNLHLSGLNPLETTLPSNIADSRPAIDQLYLSWARLYVRATSLLDPLPSEERQRRVLAAYTSALAFLTSITASSNSAALLRYVPASVPPMLVLATWIILKTQRSSYLSSIDDAAPGRIAFNAGVAALTQCSIENNDNAGRVCKMLGQLWHSDAFTDSVAGSPPVLRLRSRLVAR